MNRRTVFKLALSAALVVLALAAALTRRIPYVYLALPGMLFGFHGDLCLARAPFAKKFYRDPFLFGAASFLAGHIFYIAAFVSAAGNLGGGALAGALTVYSLVTLAAWAFAMRKSDAKPPLRFGLLGYALVIGVMASFTFAAAVKHGGVFWLTAVGGLLFVVSDGFIAVKDFIRKDTWPNGDNWIWATYVPAQLCMILTGFFA